MKRKIAILKSTEDWSNASGWRHGRAGPRTWTWDCAFAEAFGDDWKTIARSWCPTSHRDRDTVVAQLYRLIGVEVPEALAKPAAEQRERPHKRPRLLPPRDDTVHAAKHLPTVQILGDSQLVIHWINGSALCISSGLKGMVAEMHSELFKLWRDHLAMPTDMSADWATHVYREHNVEADSLASEAALSNDARHWVLPSANSGPRPLACRAFFDGSGGKSLASEADVGSGAWLAQACWATSQQAWTTIAHACFPLPGATSMAAEATAAAEAISAIQCIMRGERLLFDNYGRVARRKRRASED